MIGRDKKVKLTLTYPAATGRNFDELLRTILSGGPTFYEYRDYLGLDQVTAVEVTLAMVLEL